MPHCRITILRHLAAIAQPLGFDAKAFFRKHSLDLQSLPQKDVRVPWLTFCAMLEEAQDSVGGAAGLETVGMNTCLAFRLYRQLADLFFGLEDLYQVSVARIMPDHYGPIVQSTFRRQTDNSFRITVSVDRELPSCYPFWTLLLGQFRALPRHLQLPDAAVDVEFGDHFGEYIIIPPAGTEDEHGPASRIRKGVREHLLDDLMLYNGTNKLRDLSLDLTARTVMHQKIPCDPVALQNLLNAILTDLKVPTARLWAYCADGLLPLGDHGASSNRARLRRTLWIDSRPVGCIDVERESSGDPSAINAELDEHAAEYVTRIADLLGTTPQIPGARFSAGAAAIVNEPPIAEPPPSSRGRVRAVRNSRIGEMATRWHLTPRQASVMALLVEGLANKEIALRLGCSVGTVENHVTCILRRAEVASRAALAAAFWVQRI